MGARGIIVRPSLPTAMFSSVSIRWRSVFSSFVSYHMIIIVLLMLPLPSGTYEALLLLLLLRRWILPLLVLFDKV